MFIGLINMSSKAIGRKQERDYTFQSCEGPPDQPLGSSPGPGP